MKELVILGIVDVIRDKEGNIKVVEKGKRSKEDKLFMTMDRWVWNFFVEWHRDTYEEEVEGLTDKELEGRLEVWLTKW